MDDLGLWCNYGQIYRDIAHCVCHGPAPRRCCPPRPSTACNRLGQGFEKNDPSIMADPAQATIAAERHRRSSYLGHGPHRVVPERWDDMDVVRTPPLVHAHQRTAAGRCTTHIECYGQVGGLLDNMVFNRDAMIHSHHEHASSAALPHRAEAADRCRSCGAARTLWTTAKDYKPMNEHKANFCWWSIVTDVLHDSLTLCNWVWPMATSPRRRARNYRGDLDLEAKFMQGRHRRRHDHRRAVQDAALRS